ncbi:Cupredoxin [Aspergillus spectabilis]
MKLALLMSLAGLGASLTIGFPGPPLILDEGDNIEVAVNNFTPFNTSIHFNGIEQEGMPWSDGVPGVSQRRIFPGKQSIATFTSFHSHTSGQIIDDLYGPIYIRPRKIPARLASLITNDTFEQIQIYNAIQSPTMLRKVAVSADIDTLCADSILINGKGRVNCRDPGVLTNMVPDSVKSVLQGMEYTEKGCLRLTNTYAQTTFAHNFSAIPPSLFNECHAARLTIKVSINNHSLWVYEVDGSYIKPVQVDALTINNGGRYSCLVQLNKNPGNYSITSANSGFNQKIAGFATLSYRHGHSVISKPLINYGGVAANTRVISLNETMIEMLTPSQPSQQSDETYILTAGDMEADRPFLWDPRSPAKSPLTIGTKNDTWVGIIFSLSGKISTLQPVYVLGSGTGSFNWTSVADAVKVIPESFNLINSPMRDTFTTLPAYQVQNPGAFLIHCHIDPHLTGGMALAILDGLDSWPSIPAQYGPHGQWGSIDP